MRVEEKGVCILTDKRIEEEKVLRIEWWKRRNCEMWNEYKERKRVVICFIGKEVREEKVEESSFHQASTITAK